MTTDLVQANKLANKLKKQENLSNQKIKNGVQKIIQDYEPLITSKEAAVIFYAQKEHDTQLVESDIQELQIQNIVPDMNNISLEATVQKIDKFTYNKNGETKKGCKIILKDDTAEISLMLWNEQVDQVNTQLQGEKVKIKGGNSSEYKGETQLGFYEEVKLEKVD